MLHVNIICQCYFSTGIVTGICRSIDSQKHRLLVLVFVDYIIIDKLNIFYIVRYNVIMRLYFLRRLTEFGLTT